MTVSTNLEIPQLTDAQTEKAVATNTALKAMEDAITHTCTVATTSITTTGLYVTLPYDNSNDLSDREGLHAIRVVLSAGATQNFGVYHPANPHLFIAVNNTTKVATFSVNGTGTTYALPAGATHLLYCDGTDFTRINFTISQLQQAYDFDFDYYGNPGTASTKFLEKLSSRTVTFAADFDGSFGRVDVNPAATETYDVYENNTQIGTVSVTTSGLVQFATLGHGIKNVPSGGTLNVRTQSGTPDATISGLHIIFQGIVTIDQTGA